MNTTLPQDPNGPAEMQRGWEWARLDTDRRYLFGHGNNRSEAFVFGYHLFFAAHPRPVA